MATRTRPDGNAFSTILEKWISTVQSEVVQTGLDPSDLRFNSAVNDRIYTTIHEIEGMVHSFDFATVIKAYWDGYQNGDDELKSAAIRWLRGEYNTKTEARKALNVRVIIDDGNWYDYIKLIASFVKHIGYEGLVIFIDEAVNLYKIDHPVSRKNNYERLLAIYNDALQGKAQYLGVLFGATPTMVEDQRRGLFSYEALKTRLEESRFAREGLRDMSGPLIKLDVLDHSEIFVLLQTVSNIHSHHHKYESTITSQHIQVFMKEALKTIGSDSYLTPRTVLREFVGLLNILHQNSEESFESILGGVELELGDSFNNPEELTPENEIHDDNDSPYASFKL
jgi:hypothetical protein